MNITDFELENTRDTLEKMLESLKKHEPYATSTISAINTVIEEMSLEAEDYPE